MASTHDRDRIEQLIAPYRIDRPKSFRLADHDPGSTDGVKHKAAAQERLAEGVERLAELQARLAAQETYGLVVALPALDAAGQGGAGKHGMTGPQPPGGSVAAFQTPSPRGAAP